MERWLWPNLGGTACGNGDDWAVGYRCQGCWNSGSNVTRRSGVCPGCSGTWPWTTCTAWQPWLSLVCKMDDVCKQASRETGSADGAHVE